MIETQETEIQLPVKCPKCGAGNASGTTYCITCAKELMPFSLVIISILGLLLLIPITLAIGWVIPFTEDPTELIPFVIGIVGIFGLLGIRRGRYWAWVLIHFISVACLICFSFGAIWSLISHPIDYISRSTILALLALATILILASIRSKRIRTFCSVKKNSMTQTKSLMNASFAIFILGLSVPVLVRNLNGGTDKMVVSEHDIRVVSGNIFHSSNRVPQVITIALILLSGVIKAASPKR